MNCRMCHGELVTLHILPNHPKAVQNLYSTKEEAIASRTDLVITQCVRCGLVQLTNDPVPYYKNIIRAGGGSESMRERQREAFQGFIDYFDLRGKHIVEVGCGKGEYASILKECGVIVTGVDYPVGLPKDNFDAFMCINFLEHTPEPNKFLQAIANLLTENGVGLISVPNVGTDLFNGSLLTFMSDHLLYFSSTTLRTVLSLNGFQVVDIGVNQKLNVLSAYVRKSHPIDLYRDVERFEKLITYLETELISKKVAVWGASHHAFSLLANPRISDKISYIVDSARFKQDRFSPVSGLPICAPDQLLKEPVDIIVIVSPEYAEEIIKTIREKYVVKDILVIKDGLTWLK